MNSNTCLFFVIAVTYFSTTFHVKAQQNPPSGMVYFLSDCQQPMKVEELRLKPYRNEEARDTLFADIYRKKPQNLLLLGDLTSSGSNNKSWAPMDRFLSILHKQNTATYAIPGNHEYLKNPRRGIRNFQKRFPQDNLTGYCITIDSMAFVMVNSNLDRLSSTNKNKELMWYLATMHGLDVDNGIKIIIVCLHHAPFTNSKITGPSKHVIEQFVPLFLETSKAKLFISGHSHNLEYFNMAPNKYFLVIGGGGGLTQPLFQNEKQVYTDLLEQSKKPLYFYVTALRTGNMLTLKAHGIQKDFSLFKDFEIGKID